MNKIGKLRNGESENFNFNLKVGIEQQLAMEVWVGKKFEFEVKGLEEQHWKSKVRGVKMI